MALEILAVIVLPAAAAAQWTRDDGELGYTAAAVTQLITDYGSRQRRRPAARPGRTKR